MESKALRFITHQSFFSVVRSGDLEAVKQALDKLAGDEQAEGSSITDLMAMQNDAGETPLYVAAHNNLHEVFTYLLQFSTLQILKIRSKSDMNPFHVAAKRGHLGIVREVLGIWPELCRSCDSSNTSPLYSAAVQDHLEVVDAILDADVSTMRIVRKNGKTALHNVARYGLLRIVKTLIDRDPGIVAIKDKKSQTALHMAVKGQSTAAVKELLHVDASVLNERDKMGNTALHIATRKCRSEIVSLLLSFTSLDVNAINSQGETAMDLADKLQYSESSLEIKEALEEAGAKYARHVGQVDEAMELKRTVSDIKHEVHSQLIQNEKTRHRVSGIVKELKKLHREAVQNTTNSITVVAVLFASIAFLAIFNLPAVVVVQITLVAWDTTAQKQVVSVVNKLMWAACACTSGAFISIAYVVVGHETWMALAITLVGVPILVATLATMCYLVFRQHFGIFRSDSQRRIRRASGSKSFSWPHSVNISDDDDYNSDLEKIYAL
ncbi:ankyrin repeat-containing protein At2g01680-like isoform X2 [Cucurbita pepo subsp. pepo]|uniref:ankyrin repeat-containing protein At2g01680-like isoform X2 n=1 Tax=Cucurbita pepo subsp. pepo TaxID=3664 RepID=UPI000C9D32EC|nr:ankyrin repeat-containing protein At2g01680-like isoform X2 [Cucurbita pepo subsp. pepo]